MSASSSGFQWLKMYFRPVRSVGLSGFLGVSCILPEYDVKWKVCGFQVTSRFQSDTLILGEALDMFWHDSAHKGRHLKNWLWYFRTELVYTDTCNLHWLSLSGCMGTNSTILMENLTILHFAATEIFMFAIYFCSFTLNWQNQQYKYFFLVLGPIHPSVSFLTKYFSVITKPAATPTKINPMHQHGVNLSLYDLFYGPQIYYLTWFFFCACFIIKISLFQNKLVPYLFTLIADKGESCYQCDTMSWYIEWI